MTARASFEQACHAALTRHRQQLRDGTWQRTADNQLVDTLVKTWQTSIQTIISRRCPQCDHEAAQLAATQAARRQAVDDELSALHVRSLRKTKAGTP